jgi:hypothetical protein
VELDVTNTGAVAGAEVVQLYAGLPPEASEPPWQLRAFQKVELAPSATGHVTFTLGPDAYSFWSAGRHAAVAYPGAIAVNVGASSRDVRLSGSFAVQGGPLAGTVHPASAATLCCGAMQGVVDASGAVGAGYVTGFAADGASATFDVTAAAAGPCAITTRYTAASTPGTLSLYVDGTKIKQVTFPPLANLSTWDFETETPVLAAGDNRITLQRDPGDTGGVNIAAIIDCAGAIAFDAGALADASADASVVVDASIALPEASIADAASGDASPVCPAVCPAPPPAPPSSSGCGCVLAARGSTTAPVATLLFAVLALARRGRLSTRCSSRRAPGAGARERRAPTARRRTRS